MALIKIEGKANLQGKTKFDTGYSYKDAATAAYIAAVEAADGQELEVSVKEAIDNFIVGCKADGIWTALKASCILAGAKTLNGALVPLVGTAPTNFNFVSADYDRKTGLIGNGGAKYLNSNRAANADPQNNYHGAVYVTAAPTTTTTTAFMGERTLGRDQILSTSGAIFVRCRNDLGATLGAYNTLKLKGVSRSSSASFAYRDNGISGETISTSYAPSSSTLSVFARGAGVNAVTARMAFYSIGESIDLALLDTRVSALMTALNSAI